jgi:hypothetical protein
LCCNSVNSLIVGSSYIQKCIYRSTFLILVKKLFLLS